MNHKYKFGGLIIAAAPGWLDVTHEIEGDHPPFTLAKKDGVGVLQFSLDIYAKGIKSEVTLMELQKLAKDFGLSRELGKGYAQQVCNQPLLTYAQSFNSATHFIRVWYCSNQQDVALVTY